MENDNLNRDNPFAKGGEPGKKPANDITIVGYNILAFVVYTLIFKLMGEAGLFFEGIILVIHVSVCIIVAIAARNWFWVLSALIVLIIGVSSCAYLLTL
ncbi:hypothetical protein KXD93_05645 [Mucilaginibacter sp. BJC16-A38]|uniref:hypothetical protein n=1 Tax=Mucilaginibacter phenanthrenivorans TaxID=1234842 RepID=UPI0021579C76|nr:hypothetical protein [Mucilaginibacter phenanthrenivorans]MCR8557113.1 hypothetical protein [Mucilaginibacter phenanthrenivorans]